ncbi:hypothetical protein ACHMWN_04925 [Pedobacter sp. UC225_61]|uniref:hypothetical protein n=1 Tax=Pedobacter sp. UC225_61 TaxID=3374623 RepID=UPI0037A6ADEF
MKRNLFIFCLLLSNFCSAQNKIDTAELKKKLILTETQNNNWLDSLKKLPKEAQFSFIMKRMVLDTNVFIPKYFPDGIKPILSTPNKYTGCCKPIVVFAFKKDKKNVLVINDVVNIKIISQLHQIKKEISIDELNIYTGSTATAIYVSRAMGGVIILNISDNKSINLIKSATKI